MRPTIIEWLQYLFAFLNYAYSQSTGVSRKSVKHPSQRRLCSSMVTKRNSTPVSNIVEHSRIGTAALNWGLFLLPPTSPKTFENFLAQLCRFRQVCPVHLRNHQGRKL